eukprot:1153823-Pelagomonas_calceolata.AAC.2
MGGPAMRKKLLVAVEVAQIMFRCPEMASAYDMHVAKKWCFIIDIPVQCKSVPGYRSRKPTLDEPKEKLPVVPLERERRVEQSSGRVCEAFAAQSAVHILCDGALWAVDGFGSVCAFFPEGKTFAARVKQVLRILVEKEQHNTQALGNAICLAARSGHAPCIPVLLAAGSIAQSDEHVEILWRAVALAKISMKLSVSVLLVLELSRLDYRENKGTLGQGTLAPLNQACFPCLFYVLHRPSRPSSQADDASEVVEQRDGGGWSSLHYACCRGDADVLAELLKVPSNLDIITPFHETPLKKAQASGSSRCVQLIMEAQTNRYGKLHERAWSSGGVQ